MVIAPGQDGFAEIGLKSKGGLGGLSRISEEGDRWLKTSYEVATRIYVCQQRPSKRELRIQSHRFSKVFLCGKSVRGVVAGFERISQTTQISIISFRIICCFGSDNLLFVTCEFHSQLVGDGFSHFTLDRKDVSQFAIVRVGPEMGIIGCFN